MIAMNFSLTFSNLISKYNFLQAPTTSYLYALTDMNPSIDSACSNLWVGYDYWLVPVEPQV